MFPYNGIAISFQRYVFWANEVSVENFVFVFPLMDGLDTTYTVREVFSMFIILFPVQSCENIHISDCKQQRQKLSIIEQPQF